MHQFEQFVALQVSICESLDSQLALVVERDLNGIFILLFSGDSQARLRALVSECFAVVVLRCATSSTFFELCDVRAAAVDGLLAVPLIE